MRIIFVILMMDVTLSVCAKKYVSGSPWPAKGYKLSTWVTPLEYTAIEVQRFDKSDVFYLKLIPLGTKSGEFCFLPVSYEVADSILMFTCTDEFLPKKAERKQWIREFLKGTGIQQPMNETEWTWYKPRRQYTNRVTYNSSAYWKKFDASEAWLSYCNQRGLDPKTGDKRKQASAEGMMAFMQAVRSVLPIMAAGVDNRTQWEKFVQSGGY